MCEVIYNFSIVPEKHDFPHVVNQSDELHPVRVTFFSKSFRRLEHVNNVGKTTVWVTAVNVLLEHFKTLLHCHRGPWPFKRILLVHFLDKRNRLVPSHKAVMVLNNRLPIRGLIVTKLTYFFCWFTCFIRIGFLKYWASHLNCRLPETLAEGLRQAGLIYF